MVKPGATVADRDSYLTSFPGLLPLADSMPSRIRYAAIVPFSLLRRARVVILYRHNCDVAMGDVFTFYCCSPFRLLYLATCAISFLICFLHSGLPFGFAFVPFHTFCTTATLCLHALSTLALLIPSFLLTSCPHFSPPMPTSYLSALPLHPSCSALYILPIPPLPLLPLTPV